MSSLIPSPTVTPVPPPPAPPPPPLPPTTPHLPLPLPLPRPAPPPRLPPTVSPASFMSPPLPVPAAPRPLPRGLPREPLGLPLPLGVVTALEIETSPFALLKDVEKIFACVGSSVESSLPAMAVERNDLSDVFPMAAKSLSSVEAVSDFLPESLRFFTFTSGVGNAVINCDGGCCCCCFCCCSCVRDEAVSNELPAAKWSLLVSKVLGLLDSRAAEARAASTSGRSTPKMLAMLSLSAATMPDDVVLLVPTPLSPTNPPASPSASDEKEPNLSLLGGISPGSKEAPRGEEEELPRFFLGMIEALVGLPSFLSGGD